MIELQITPIDSGESFPPINLISHFENDGVATLRDTGSSICVTLCQRTYWPYIFGGPLSANCVYAFDVVQFHWPDSAYSELCDGHFSQDMEAHILHINTKYISFNEAIRQPDGISIMVLGFRWTDCNDDILFEETVSGVRRIIPISVTQPMTETQLRGGKREKERERVR